MCPPWAAGVLKQTERAGKGCRLFVELAGHPLDLGVLMGGGGSAIDRRSALEIYAADPLHGVPLRLAVAVAVYHRHLDIAVAQDLADRHDVHSGPDHPAQRGILEAVG